MPDPPAVAIGPTHSGNQLPAVEHFDVLIVGAGLSGIGAACHLRREHPQRSFTILEARDAIGGTWDLFRYPGVRSDTDMYTMGYVFSPWTDNKTIGDGSTIAAYIRRTADQFGVAEHVRYGHKVVRATWSSAQARWTVTAERGDGSQPGTFTCSLLYVCSGYYRYDQPYTPEFPGIAEFGGQIAHPQFWPEDLDYAGKRVVVIGSGATAVTLVPAMAERAARVTMLQRSPSYIISLPARDVIAERLRRLLPGQSGYMAARWKNMRLGLGVYQLSRKAPKLMRGLIAKGIAKQLPDGYDVGTHFNPQYEPWDQRLCFAQDGDLFAAIRHGRAEVVTDRIVRFTTRGIELESGTELPADIVVTATGLNLLALGGIELVVDDTPVQLNQTFAYKALALSGVPNLVFTVGYTNASWTLKADLTAQYVCRLLAYCDENGYEVFEPVAPDSLEREPLIGLTSGYVQRSLADFPSQGTVAPWRVNQHYPRDMRLFRRGPVNDSAMRFGHPTDPDFARVDGPRTVTVNGRRVRYRETGEGPPVLLIHGVGRSLEDWSEQHDLLSHAYRVISLDLAGFGESQRLAGTTTLTGLARFVGDVLESLGIAEPVRMAGNSLGGAVAMQFAAQSPQRVHSLLLVDSAGFGREVTRALRVLAIRPLGRLLLRHPTRSLSERVVRSLFYDASYATPARVERAMALAVRPDGTAVMEEILRSLGGVRGVAPEWRRELLPAVVALNLPTLVVWGDHDQILPASHLDAARATFPNAETHLFPATGHMPQIERAGEFAKLALDFWA